MLFNDLVLASKTSYVKDTHAHTNVQSNMWTPSHKSNNSITDPACHKCVMQYYHIIVLSYIYECMYNKTSLLNIKWYRNTSTYNKTV